MQGKIQISLMAHQMDHSGKAMSPGEKLMFVLGAKYGVLAVSTSFMTGTLPPSPTRVDDR